MGAPGSVVPSAKLVVERGRAWVARTSVVYRSGALAASLLAFLPVIAFFGRNPPIGIQALIASLVMLAVIRPAAAWLVVAGLSPFGHLLRRLADCPWSVTEQIVLAFLAGWLAREAFQRHRAGRDSGWSRLAVRLGLLFALAVVSSLAVQLVVLQVSTTFPLEFAGMVWRFLWRDYHAYPSPLPTIPGAAFILEGVGLFVATVVLTTRRPALQQVGAGVFAGAAAAVAAVNLVDLVRQVLALARVGPLTLAGFMSVRVSYVFPDVNAAGSYFVMALFVATGLVNSTRRCGRLAWVLATLLVLAGLWFSGSRTALVAAPLVGGVVWGILGLRGGRLPAKIIVPALLGLAILATAYFVASPRSAPPYQQAAVRWRTEMSATAFRMFRAYPVFGIGPGLFYERSYDFSTPEWLAVAPPRENAHNNFMQVLAELGGIGLVVLLALLTAIYGASLRCVASGTAAWAIGLAAGGVAFIATWMGGHPLLIREVALSFWIVLGLAAAKLRVQPQREMVKRWQSRGVAAAAVVMVVLVPVMANYRLVHADLSREGRGFSQWHREPDGTRFRWMFRRAVLYVPASAREVSVGVRSPGGVATVRVTVDGKQVCQFLTSETEWREVRVEVPSNYSWASVPVELTVRGFQPSAARTPLRPVADERIQVALPQVIR